MCAGDFHGRVLRRDERVPSNEDFMHSGNLRLIDLRSPGSFLVNDGTRKKTNLCSQNLIAAAPKLY
jgi:hypothetical protein